MTNQKLPKQNIIRNTGDIAPPKGSVFGVSANNKSNQRSISTGSVVENNRQYRASNQPVQDNDDFDEQPFIHKINKNDSAIKNNSPNNSSGKLSGKSDYIQRTPIQKTTDSVPVGVQENLQVRTISFNHTQHVNYDNQQLAKPDKFNNVQPKIENQLSTQENLTTASGELYNYQSTNTSEQDAIDQQVEGFFSDNRRINLKNQAKDKQKLHKKTPKKKAPLLGFTLGVSMAVFLIGGLVFLSLGYQSKKTIEVKGVQAINYLKEAKADLENKNFELASENLLAAKKEFEDSQKQLDKIGGQKLNLLKYIPILSKASSGKNLVDLGAYLTDSVYELSQTSKLLNGLQNPFASESKNSFSVTDLLMQLQPHLIKAKKSLAKAEIAGKNIKVEDLPTPYVDKIKTIQEILPLVNDNLADTDRFVKIFLELFGQKGPRKYLIVFQNNQEMRATGGFIGSYGLLETNAGKMEKLKIEGIYNPDGQLKVNVVPPRPIQKISATWSTHDANWWPDFPKSAKKISWFYEKTGGPTTDGVIAVTPTVLEKMLAITGPIEMPEYNLTVTDKNFIKVIQKQVEEDYDKEENKPKKILADLTPKIFTKFFNLKSPKQIAEAVKVLLNALEEKHILMYFTDREIENTVAEQGWAGKILDTDKDYLAVINTNINGFKTDGIIDEIINHQAKIETDGSVIDTVTITRKHRGGNTSYEWWNKVNSDYMRIYVPKGSKLISVSGQTREFTEPRLAYDKLGFQVDADVAKEEKYMKIDPASGTRIYDESNKTVFANWVYVSPHEQATIVYKYKLPFKVNPLVVGQGGYSLLMQKQSGSTRSKLIAEVEFPFRWRATWLHPEDMNFDKENNKFIYKHNLNTDQFIGVVFEEK